MKSELEEAVSSQMADFAGPPSDEIVPERIFSESAKRFTVTAHHPDDSYSDYHIGSERLLVNEGNRWQQVTGNFLRERRRLATWQFWWKLLLVSVTVILLGGLLGGLYPKALSYDIDVKMLANINPNLPINITNSTGCEGAHFEFIFTLKNRQLISNVLVHDVDIRMLAATIQISNLTKKNLGIVYAILLFLVYFLNF